nr:MAG TPA: hypothetical protein [Caudoviricetes sp.]
MEKAASDSFSRAERPHFGCTSGLSRRDSTGI